MPFTPFHMGPGMAVKAVSGKKFSLIAFGVAQIAMDTEPLVRMIRGDRIVHGFTHTYVGAVLIGALVLPVVRPLGAAILRLWNRELISSGHAWLACDDTISWTAASVGVFIGTFSHVLLDSLMHADLEPFAPFASSNPLLHAISLVTLHSFCLVTGLLGVAAWIAVRYHQRSVNTRQ